MTTSNTWLRPINVVLTGGVLLFGTGCVFFADSWLLYPWFAAGLLACLLFTRFSSRCHTHILDVSFQGRVRDAQRGSRESERLSAKFLANVSHECRTPLSTVIGYAECMLRGYDGATTEEQQKDLKAIIQNANELLQLLEDVLQLAKVESGHIDLELQPFSLDTCIRSVIQSLQTEADKRQLKLQVELEEGLPPLLGDPVKVRRILLNLVENAIKYTPQGKILIHGSSHPPYAQICVEDTGLGISPSELKHIFDPFYQSGGGRSGAGLGLSIVKNLVEAHAGRIEVQSKLGQGSAFIISLPLAIPELKAQIRTMLEQQLEPPRREIAYRLYQWLNSPEEDKPWQEAGAPS